MSTLIRHYFPGASAAQHAKFDVLPELYAKWNSQINVISRKDIDHLELRHVLHSLAILKFTSFQAGSRILDIGTGGGFPGIPLAIMMPDVQFILADSIGKKIKVVKEIASELGLTNVEGIHERAEKLKGPFDFVVSRAVAPLPLLLSWSRGKYNKHNINALPNGLICLKGGDLKEEMKGIKGAQAFAVSDFFGETFFDEKKLIYVPV